MISFPQDILKTYARVELEKAEMKAICIPADGTFKGGNILQTTHCLELVLSGRIKIHHGDHAQEIHENDIQFRKRGNYQLVPDERYSSILFFLDDAFINDFLREIKSFSGDNNKEETAFMLFQSSPFIKNNRDHALKNITEYKAFSPCIVKLTALQILFQLFSSAESKRFIGYLRSLIRSNKIDLSYFMETNFTQKIDLNDIARLTGRSLSTLKKDFAKQFNTTPQRWLINRRLELAHYLLNTSEKPVSEIAYETGFENTSHFSRAYKAKYGESPKTSRFVVA